MRNFSIRIGGYDVSVLFIIALGTLFGTAVGTYCWTTTSTITIEEPLTITNYPTSVHTHPGENQTLDITVENVATASYTVTLTFTLNDTTYQTSYVTFSNYTYTISPGINQITGWMATQKNAPPTTIQLTTNFYRE